MGADIAVETFDPELHGKAVFAGGYPALRGWLPEQIPAADRREAHPMARPLIARLTEIEKMTSD